MPRRSRRITEEHHSFLLAGKEYSFVLKKSDRRTLALQIYPDQRIVVRAPRRVKESDIDRLLQDRSEWILKHLHKLSERPALPPQPCWRSGEKHLYLGKHYPLNIQKGDRSNVDFQDDSFRIIVAEPDDEKAIQSLMEQWYKQEANSLFRERVDYWQQETQNILKLPKTQIPIKIRAMKTRWGSCSSRGNINLNLLLIKTPRQCIDYVIVHELCHFREMNHSKKFWKLVTDCLPDWKRHKQTLRQLEPELLRNIEADRE